MQEEVTVEVDGDNVLHISAEHKDEKEEGEKVTRSSRSGHVSSGKPRTVRRCYWNGMLE